MNNTNNKKPNPYELVYFRRGWSENRVSKNNTKYWAFEMEHKELTIP